MHILLIEDEIKTAQYLRQGLEEKGFRVDVVFDGSAGRQLVDQKHHDLIITDVVMPGMDGRELCRQIRQSGKKIPILMLTALGATDDVVAGLDSGADDYLVKPFAFEELLARIRTLVRRITVSQENHLQALDLVLDLDKRKVFRAGKPLNLTAKEMELLTFFLQNKNKVVSKSTLAKMVWKIDFETGTNMVEVYVNYLRKKIDHDFSPKLLITHFGIGYELHDPGTSDQ